MKIDIRERDPDFQVPGKEKLYSICFDDGHGYTQYSYGVTLEELKQLKKTIRKFIKDVSNR